MGLKETLPIDVRWVSGSVPELSRASRERFVADEPMAQARNGTWFRFLLSVVPQPEGEIYANGVSPHSPELLITLGRKLRSARMKSAPTSIKSLVTFAHRLGVQDS